MRARYQCRSRASLYGHGGLQRSEFRVRVGSVYPFDYLRLNAFWMLTADDSVDVLHFYVDKSAVFSVLDHPVESEGECNIIPHLYRFAQIGSSSNGLGR